MRLQRISLTCCNGSIAVLFEIDHSRNWEGRSILISAQLIRCDADGVTIRKWETIERERERESGKKLATTQRLWNNHTWCIMRTKLRCTKKPTWRSFEKSVLCFVVERTRTCSAQITQYIYDKYLYPFFEMLYRYFTYILYKYIIQNIIKM